MIVAQIQLLTCCYKNCYTTVSGKGLLNQTPVKEEGLDAQKLYIETDKQ